MSQLHQPPEEAHRRYQAIGDDLMAIARWIAAANRLAYGHDADIELPDAAGRPPRPGRGPPPPPEGAVKHAMVQAGGTVEHYGGITRCTVCRRTASSAAGRKLLLAAFCRGISGGRVDRDERPRDQRQEQQSTEQHAEQGEQPSRKRRRLNYKQPPPPPYAALMRPPCDLDLVRFAALRGHALCRNAALYLCKHCGSHISTSGRKVRAMLSRPCPGKPPTTTASRRLGRLSDNRHPVTGDAPDLQPDPTPTLPP